MRNPSLSLMISIALAGGLALAAPTFAQDANGEPDAPAGPNAPDQRLAERHGESSAEAIAGLRAGGSFIVDGVVVENSNSAMGHGEIDMALSLADALVESGAAADLAAALNTDLLDMRAEGMGWGEIAQAFGFTIGEVMSAGRGTAGLAAGLAAGTAADLESAAAELDLGRDAATAASATANVNASANANVNARVGLDRTVDARAGAAAAARVDAGLDTRAVLRERPVTRERPAAPERPALPLRPALPVRVGGGG